MTETQNNREEQLRQLAEYLEPKAIDLADIALKWGVEIVENGEKSGEYTFSTHGALEKDFSISTPISIYLDTVGRNIVVSTNVEPLAPEQIKKDEFIKLRINSEGVDEGVRNLKGEWNLFWDEQLRGEDILMNIVAINAVGEDMGLLDKNYTREPKNQEERFYASKP